MKLNLQKIDFVHMCS